MSGVAPRPETVPVHALLLCPGSLLLCPGSLWRGSESGSDASLRPRIGLDLDLDPPRLDLDLPRLDLCLDLDLDLARHWPLPLLPT